MNEVPHDGTSHEKLVSCSIADDDECPLTGILRAFRAIGLDVQSRPTRLDTWVDVEAVESVLRSTGPEASVHARIWGHPVVMTHRAVTVYAEGDD